MSPLFQLTLIFLYSQERMQSDTKINILLVDDQPENLLALEAVLGDLGENLVRANSGQEALRHLLSRDFAVILMDVQMPGMDGFETATLIRSRARSRHVPIIFLTAFSASDQLMFKGYALGAVDYLFKPIESSILISKVTVFVDLFKKSESVQRQAAQLVAMNGELRQSEERFRSLSACSPVGVFVIDSAGHCTYANPRFQAICGLTEAQSLAAGWFPSVYAADQDRAIAQWMTHVQSGGDYSEEVRFESVDYTLRWMHVRSSPMLSAQGDLLGYVGTIEDITERKQAEETHAEMVREQIARQEAEAMSRMKDEFLAVLSHELRTPLNSMLGWARLLRSKKMDETSVARALATIERNAEAQSRLIEDILDMSKIIRGKLQLNCCAVNLIQVVEIALDSVRLQADAKAIQITATIDRSIGKVWSDPVRLQQVILNLLTNAIKFTPDKGTVEVRLEWENDEEVVRLQVVDTGIGIHADFLPRVFDRFRQADSSTTRSFGGLGLGLAIVRHLVELTGGTIRAESPGEGKGSTFTIVLPLWQGSDPLLNQAVSEDLEGANVS